MPAHRSTIPYRFPTWMASSARYCILKHGDGIEHRVHHHILAHGGVNHEMVEMASRPLDLEILLVVSRAVLVHSLGQQVGFVLALAKLAQPYNFLFERRIDEHVEGGGVRSEIVCRTASHNDAIAFAASLQHNLFGRLANTIGIRYLHPLSIHSAFEAAAHESLEQPVVQGIAALLAFLNRPAIAIHDASDLGGKQLVPELPSQALGQFSGDLGGAAAIFPVDRNNFDHGQPRWPPAVRASTHGHLAARFGIVLADYEGQQKHYT